MKVIDFHDANCKHCYKCVRNCRVKAISVKNEQAHIVREACIHCGLCLEVCPQNAKTFASDIDRIKRFLRTGTHTVVSLAPSFMGVLPYEKPGQIVHALLKLGFSEVRETAEGAAMVTKEYQRLLEEDEMENIITTCCPSMNDLIEKYHPSLTKFMAPVVSPMVAHGRMIKKMYGEDTKVIFMGPCIAKKEEAMGDKRVIGAIDAILTFEEFLDWVKAEGIDINTCEDKPVANPAVNVNRAYPVSGGVIRSIMADEIKDSYHKLYVDGIDACIELLESMEKGELEHCFVEVNICDGGCIKGPASKNWKSSFTRAKLRVEEQVQHAPADEAIVVENLSLSKKFGDRSKKQNLPSESEIKDILRRIGKMKKEDELNCGACGYPSCRAKAVAVYQGKAEVDMCLPYAVARAESMSNVVMDETPNLVLIVNRELRICECNKLAQKFLGVNRKEALESYIFEYIETQDIEDVLETKKAIINRKIDHPQIHLKAEESIVYIEDLDAVLIIYQDISKQELAKEKRLNLKMETVEMAQRVIDKQMMVAQQIAGLLGETTAETKVTLTKLRDSILFDDEEE